MFNFGAGETLGWGSKQTDVGSDVECQYVANATASAITLASHFGEEPRDSVP